MLNQNLLLAGDDAYNLTRSLRFRSSASAYLSRTPASASNRKTWTWSAWVKRGTLGAIQNLFMAGTTGNDFFVLQFNPSDQLNIQAISGGVAYIDTLTSSAVYRDPSAWYHIVCQLDLTNATQSDRCKLYVNGSRITALATNNITATSSQNFEINNTVAHAMGRNTISSATYVDLYLAEVNFIDGQALTPSSFGATNAQTGVWQPAKYTGTYGTNGFYLPFTDNSALTTSSNAGLGKDFSGNGNYWTTNNISITSGSTYDSMTDVPTLTSATAANYCVLNPLANNTTTISNANLNWSFSGSTAGTYWTRSTLAITSGKWYWEVTPTDVGVGPNILIGVQNSTTSVTLGGTSGDVGTGYAYYPNGNKVTGTTFSAYGASYAANDVIGIALDMDGGTITFYKNNTSQGTAFTGITGSITPLIATYIGGGATRTTAGSINFGQQPFTYTPPSGFVALNTFNLPTPTIGATPATQANKYFDINLWAGNNANPRTLSGLLFQPDFVWLKDRTQATNHRLVDAVRGASKTLKSNLTDAETSSESAGTITAFTSDGFTVQGTSTVDGVNLSGDNYVAWNWKANGSGSSNTDGSITSTVSANTSAGFSVVTFTNPNPTTSGWTVGHGLGVAPSMYIVKQRSATSGWYVYHTSIGAGNFLQLQKTDASTANTSAFNNTAPTSTVISLGGASGNSYYDASATSVAYCFAPIAGYSAFGSYTGNGSSDGPFVFTGFRPRYVMWKRTDSTGDWGMEDGARDPYNTPFHGLYANLSNAEDTAYNLADLLSNGFKLRGAVVGNASGGTYIYMAFAEFPFRYSLAR